MKQLRIIAVLGILTCAAWAQSVVQSTFVDNGYSTPQSKAFTSSVTAGDMLFAWATPTSNGSYNLTGVSTTAEGAWTACPTPFPYHGASCYYTTAVSSGARTVNATFTSGVGYVWGIVEVSGANTVDVAGSGTGTGTALSATTSGSVTATSEIQFGIGGYSFSLCSVGSGFTSLGFDSSNYCGAEYKVLSGASGTQTATMSVGTSETWYMTTVTFKNAPQAAAPTYNVAAGWYNTAQTVTISDSTTGNTIKYCQDTTNTCTPGSSGTSYGTYSTPLTVSSTGYLRSFATASGYTQSPTTSAYYLISGNDQQIASDNFQSYYDPTFWCLTATCAGAVNEYPLASQWTNGLWMQNGSQYMTPILDSEAGGTLPSGTVDVVGSVTLTFATYVGVGFNPNQFAKAYVHGSTGGAGVSVRGSTTGAYTGYLLDVSGTLQSLQKCSTGTCAPIATGTQTVADNSSVELRIYGSTLQPLINGAGISSMTACYPTCTDSTITTGAPGVESSTTSSPVYNWTGGNIGVTTQAYVVNLQDGTPGNASTYSDAMNSSGWTPAAPWANIAPSPWPGPMCSVLVSGSTYAAGNCAANAQYEYRANFGPFMATQWTSALNATDARWDAVFSPLKHTASVPGYHNGGCTAAGTTSTCFDDVGIYPGVEPMNFTARKSGQTSACTAKNEYIGTPFLHVTEIDPVTSTGNQVNTVGGSTTTVMYGDTIRAVYAADGHIRVYGKQNSTPLPTWQASTAMTAGTTTCASGTWTAANGCAPSDSQPATMTTGQFIEDSAGHIQLVVQSGTTGSTAPSTWGSEWLGCGDGGQLTYDGSVVWMYFGDTVPTTNSFTLLIDAMPSSGADSYFRSSKGFPGLFIDSGANNLVTPFPTPVFTAWSAWSLQDNPLAPTILHAVAAVADSQTASDSETSSTQTCAYLGTCGGNRARVTIIW